MSIRRKLVYSFSLLTLFLMLQFVVNFYFDQRQQTLVKSMEDEQQISNQLSMLAIAAQKIRRYEKEYFIYVGNATRRQHYYTEFTNARKVISSLLGSLKLTFTRFDKVQMKNQVVAWELATQAYARKMDDIHYQVQEGKIDSVFDANDAIKRAKNKFRAVIEGAEQAIDDSYRLALGKSKLIHELHKTSSTISALMVLISVLVGIIIAIVVPNSIARPLRELSAAANRISKGNINESVEITGSAEITDLSYSLQQMQNTTFNLIKRAQNPQAEAS